MLFNSLEFFLLLIITLLLYWQSSSLYWRQNILLISSFIFYASWSTPYLILFLLLIVIAYFLGLKISQRNQQRWLSASVIFFLSILAIFKYTNFGLALIQNVVKSLGIDIPISPLVIQLPLGISFIVFEFIAYLVDVRRQTTSSEKSLRLFTLFIMLFPHLIAGPICRSNQLIPQLKIKIPFNFHQFTGGIVLLMAGLLLKVGIADGIAPFVDSVFSSSQEVERGSILLGTLGFGVQVFCDFWGYSTMAVGAAQLFGIDIPINFNLPYLATSLREFWRRWHITLSTWLRDYLYIPLGGSRQGNWQTARNLMITMGLCGLWHGAGINFIIWGLLHGFYLVLERGCIHLFKPIKKSFGGKAIGLIWVPFGWLITIGFVSVTWIFFRAKTIEDSFSMLGTLFNPTSAIDLKSAPTSFYILLLAFICLHIPLSKLIDLMQTDKISINWRIVAAGWLLVLSIVMSAGESVQFIYFEF
ncbi:MBOAT family O-acyltransferase [Merismopedia glauca]|uniref:MBOAT family protein n=1 Tax=Merismopedia glauca CCAP 1448/3 TaxID=1296344 RepID=A0A2T1C798_9CYAN|nr:MBOAT family O-acyltransferase [Merismopedia glauca]PSB04129.1 MBOAT family protein [Merismopedia glauca CCAP 1448/3]